MRFLFLSLILLSQLTFAQKRKPLPEQVWVDSVYNQLNFDEKVAQLFMVAAYSNKDNKHIDGLVNLVKDYKIGGVIFFQGGPGRQAKITNKLQAASKVPLLIGIDAEWGLSMRLDSTYRYPWNMTLGAVQKLDLIEQMGEQMGEQANRMGIHFTFGPVVDINTNPKNPIIGNRSFGETREIVTDHALSFMEGLQSKNVFATAKHFPGHGDTSTDSHHALPYLDFTRKRLDDIELYPYRKLIEKGLASIMVAHLDVPVLEPRPGVPTSLSYATITTLLRNELKFNGLIFTDALNMKAATNYKPAGEVDLEAFLAGNDVMLFAENVPLAIQKIKEAYDNGKITENRLAASVKKILAYKYKAGLYKYRPIDYKNLYHDLNASEYDDLNKKLYEAAITVIKDEDMLPLRKSEKIAYVKLGDDINNTFIDALKRKANITTFFSTSIESAADLDGFDKVIVGFHKADGAWKNHDFTQIELDLLDTIATSHPTVLVAFTKPYALSAIQNFDALKGVVSGYQNNVFAHNAAVEVLFGNKSAKGKLPVSINAMYKVNGSSATGYTSNEIKKEEKRPKEVVKSKITPLKNNDSNTVKQEIPVVQEKNTIPVKDATLVFSTPEKEGMNASRLKEIDRIAQAAIDKEYTPGIQVLVARNGKIIYEKSYGKQTYDNGALPVKDATIYDLASLSKILGTLPMVMKMYDEGVLTFAQTLGEWLPEFKNTDKSGITIKELLLHESGLVAWIPFYKETLLNGHPDPKLYKNTYSPEYPIQVAENLFLKKDYNKTIINTIKESKLGAKSYKYSDLNFILLKEIVERHYKKPLDILVSETFYKPIGTQLTYNPLHKVDMDFIAPTEEDEYYRYTRIQGYVHDMGAAMFGGVAGHAGVFGNAEDVFKMMQFYLDGGSYKGNRILRTKTINDFNTCYSCGKGSRRGAGFDKQQLKGGGPTCGCASARSFGHTGFTGTIAWADPEYDLVYVFLSNRTYPSADDNKLSKANVREDIQQVIYDAIKQ